MASSPVCASEVAHPALLEVLVALTGVLFGVHLVAVSDVSKNQQRYFEHASEQVSSRDEEVQVLLVVPWGKKHGQVSIDKTNATSQTAALEGTLYGRSRRDRHCADRQRCGKAKLGFYSDLLVLASSGNLLIKSRMLSRYRL